MKTLLKLSPAIGITLMLFFATGALFAPNGMALVPPSGHEWLTAYGAIASNFVNFWNAFGVAIGIMTIIGFFSDDHIENSVRNMVNWVGVIETGKELQFKKIRFIFLTIPYWIVLVASGWVATVIIWIVVTILNRIESAAKLKYFNEHYLKGDDNAKDITPAGLSDNPLG